MFDVLLTFNSNTSSIIKSQPPEEIVYKFFCALVLLLITTTPLAANSVAVVKNKGCNVLVKSQTPEDANVSVVIFVLKMRDTSRKDMAVDYLAVRINKVGSLLGGYSHSESKPAPQFFTKDVVTYDDLKWLDGDLSPLPNRLVEKEMFRLGEYCKDWYLESLTDNAFLPSRMANSLKKKINR